NSGACPYLAPAVFGNQVVDRTGKVVSVFHDAVYALHAHYLAPHLVPIIKPLLVHHSSCRCPTLSWLKRNQHHQPHNVDRFPRHDGHAAAPPSLPVLHRLAAAQKEWRRSPRSPHPCAAHVFRIPSPPRTGPCAPVPRASLPAMHCWPIVRL